MPITSPLFLAEIDTALAAYRRVLLMHGKGGARQAMRNRICSHVPQAEQRVWGTKEDSADLSQGDTSHFGSFSGIAFGSTHEAHRGSWRARLKLLPLN
jgi:hypothetical protein